MIRRTPTYALPLPRHLVVATITAAVCASVPACSSSGGSATTALGTTSPSTSAPSASATSASAPAALVPTWSAPAFQLSVTTTPSATSAGAGAPIPTGKQLAGLFTGPPPPTGFTVDAAGTMDSGDTLADVTDDPYISLKSCVDLTNAGATSLVSDYKASDAQVTLRNAASGDEVDILVAAYAPGNAARQWQEVTTLYNSAECTKGYTAPTLDNGVNATLKASSTPVAGLGTQAVDLKIQPTDPRYVSAHAFMVRVADRIIVVTTDSQKAASVDLKPIAMAYYQALSK